MATLPAVPALVSMQAYLGRHFEKDLEFVDGVLVERTGEGLDHALLLAALGHWFVSHGAEWKIEALSSYWVKTSPTRVRMPDLCVVWQSDPVEQVRVTAPLLCIEILGRMIGLAV